MNNLTARQFITELNVYRPSSSPVDYHGSLEADETDQFIGVRMGKIFAVAKSYTDMPLKEVEILLESPVHEYRVGAVSIMDFRARKKLTDDQRKALFDLYIRRHDRINSWDLVDRSAIHVLGGYLIDKPRDILYRLARSPHPYERRSSVVTTIYFSKRGDTGDAFGIAEILLDEKDELVRRAVGWALRTAGGKELLTFLDKHAPAMPRLMLTVAIEKLTPSQRKHYRALRHE
ncbi:MAG TPA: DNA alkylation repair protein [Candidatus Saccharimonadales bacterium]|nr:DNA alkylation repair protein [Candidatus Saccharimonadales bacterium]